MTAIFRPFGLVRVRALGLAAWVWLAFVVCGLGFFVLQVTVHLAGRRLDSFTSTWLYDSLEVAASAAVAARAAIVRQEREAWLLLTAALVSWTVGDILWDALYHGNPPFPSIADGFYLAFYPLAYVALTLLVRFRLSRFNASIWLDGLTAALAVAAVGAAVLLDVVLHTTHAGWFKDAVNLAYPLGDILLVALVVGVFALTRWRPGAGWLPIASALVLTALADSLYLYQSAVATYTAGTILDALWPVSLVLLAGAAWVAPRRRGRVDLEGRPLAATPVLSGLLAIAVLVDCDVQHRNLVAVALASATLVTVLLRTLLTFQENARITARASSLAITDPLTGLWNRRRLHADLSDVLESELSRPHILVLYDLNGFKTYNDTFGHPAGDALLSRLAAKLQRALPSDATCYRLGGDEFCVLAAIDLAESERLVHETTEALSEHGEGFTITTGFGCVFLPDEAQTPSEALHTVDERLYAQKHQSALRGGQPHRVILEALFEREPDLRDHVGTVSRLCLLVARELRLDGRSLEGLKLAAQLHDVGKLAIPDGILAKPGPLDPDEWALIHRHTTIGQRILNASPAFYEVGRVVRATHERWDGAGYPDGLAGVQIPLQARVIAVCDAYSAMTAPRPYQASRTPQAALNELRRCAGSHFDPDVVDAFVRVHAERDAPVAVA